MNRNYLLFTIILCVLLAFPSIGKAEKGSYLDSIFNAEQGGTSSLEEDVNYISDSETPQIVDIPQPTAIPGQQRAMNRLQQLVNNIIRMIMGRMCGVRVKIIIIPVKCPRPPTQKPTVVQTPPAPKPVPTQPKPTTVQKPPVSTPPVSKPTVSPPSQPAPTTISSNPQNMSEAQLKASLKAKYGFSALDGQGATWSKNQLIAADEAFASLPEYFRSCTDVIYRDGPPPSFAPAGTSGYVIVPQRKIHMLDASVTASQWLYNSLISRYGRKPTNAELMANLKYNFQRTIVHEMTHCFQNTHPDISRAWQNTFWPGGRLTGNCPTSYGRTQPVEDMAESVATYWVGGKIEGGYFKARNGNVMDIKRYNFIKNYVMNGKEYLIK